LSRSGIPRKSIREYVDGKRRQLPRASGFLGPAKAAVEDKAAGRPRYYTLGIFEFGITVYL
jgi:hypothetical protein